MRHLLASSFVAAKNLLPKKLDTIALSNIKNRELAAATEVS